MPGRDDVAMLGRDKDLNNYNLDMNFVFVSQVTIAISLCRAFFLAW